VTLRTKARIAGASAALLLLALAAHLGGLGTPRDAALAVTAVLAGAPTAVAAYQALRLRAFSIELLVTIAVTGALLIGEYVEAGVVAFLFVVGAWLEARTLDRTRRSLRELIDLAPQQAEVLRHGVGVVVPVEEVDPGDTVLVRHGGKVPVDGTVVEGTGLVDEATITGEPVPAAKGPGDPVWSGTVLTTGFLTVTAEKVGEDTTFARIVELVEEAQDSRAGVQRSLDRFAAVYTPAVVGLAVLALVLTRDVRFALTFLVIACPGALVISTPVSMVAGLGNAARRGALVKGGDALERLARVDTLVLDKTGTLTVGRPEVTDVVSTHPDLTDAEVLRQAAALEQASEHPLGRTLVDAAVARGLDLGGLPTDVQVVTGAGLRGTVRLDGHSRYVAVGTPRVIGDGYAVPEPVQGRALALERRGGTVVHVVVDGELAGLVAVTDRVRPEAAEAIAALRRQGIDRFVVLTGDNEHTARAVAEQVGVDEVRARLLPEDKVTAIRELQAAGRRVAMVGDGVNDAPAIATADVGLAMGAGTDVSLEAADVVLVGNRFDHLVHARSVARATRWNVVQNTVIALATVVVLLAGVVAGVVVMASGMLVHEVSVLAVVLNAVRLARHRCADADRLARAAGRSTLAGQREQAPLVQEAHRP